MLDWLRVARCYLYTGTQPASYTLGLIEAMMTGTPVVSIGPQFMDVFPYGPDLFEGWQIVHGWGEGQSLPRGDVLAWARGLLWNYLSDRGQARIASKAMRQWAIELFGRERVGAQWRAFLGAP